MMKDFFTKNNIELPSIDEADKLSNPNIVAHFVHSSGAEWWVIGGEKQVSTDGNGDVLLFGMAKIFCQELGMFSLGELLSVGAMLDTDWKVQGLYDVFPKD